MRSIIAEAGQQFHEQPDLVIDPHKTGKRSLLHAPIGSQLFHSRPYGPLFDLDEANGDTSACGEPDLPRIDWRRAG